MRKAHRPFRFLLVAATVTATFLVLLAAPAAARAPGADVDELTPRLQSSPTTVTITMYRDQATAPVSRLSVVPTDTPLDFVWGGMAAGSLPDGVGDVSWVRADGFSPNDDHSVFSGNLRVSRPSWYAGTYTGHVTVPSGDARVADATMTVVCRVIAKTRAAVRLTASVPTGFVEGYSIKVAGSLHTTSGKNMSGSVSIQRRMRDDALDSWDPVWTTIKTVKLSRGAYSTYVKAIAGCQIRVVYNGTSTYRWTASAAKLVRQRVVLNRPTIGLSLTYLARTSTYAIHGHCTPTHFDSYDMSGDGTTEYPSRVIRVQVQRYYRGAWRNEASADVTEADGTWAVSFTPNNTRKGRIRAYDICADHDRAYSAWKYFYIFH